MDTQATALRRERRYPYSVGTALPAELGARIDRASRRFGMSKSWIVRLAVQRGLKAAIKALDRAGAGDRGRRSAPQVGIMGLPEADRLRMRAAVRRLAVAPRSAEALHPDGADGPEFERESDEQEYLWLVATVSLATADAMIAAERQSPMHGSEGRSR